MNPNKYYIFYDGDCGFCNYWIIWLLKKDVTNRFLFSSLQSEFGQEYLKQRILPTSDLSTIYLWKPQDYYLQKSHAIFKILNLLPFPYNLISYFKVLPNGLTDVVYNVISKNRKKIIKNNCYLPTIEERQKFIE